MAARRQQYPRRQRSAGFTYPFPRPAVTVDVAVFAAGPASGHTGVPRLRVLLIQRGQDPFAGRWALPGGFVDEMEDLPAAALRELKEETGLDAQLGPQVGAYGAPGRDPRGHTISVACVAWLAGGPVDVRGLDDAVDARWHDARKPPPLAFDHRDVLRDGVASLRRICRERGDDAAWTRLLPRRFTVGEAAELLAATLELEPTPTMKARVRRALRSHREVHTAPPDGRVLRFRRTA